MIAVDTNILVYAHRRDSAFHGPAAAAVRRLAEARADWAIPWPCIHEFLAVVTHRRIYDPPTPITRALAQVEAWLGSPTLVVLGEALDHWELMTNLAASAKVTGPRFHDARIAAICLGAGIHELWSADRDFSRYPLMVRNPIVS